MCYQSETDGQFLYVLMDAVTAYTDASAAAEVRGSRRTCAPQQQHPLVRGTQLEQVTCSFACGLESDDRAPLQSPIAPARRDERLCRRASNG